MSGPTPFAESNALLALDDDAPDYPEARESLSDFSIGELLNLERQAKRLVDLCRTMANEKRNEIEDGA